MRIDNFLNLIKSRFDISDSKDYYLITLDDIYA